MTDEKKRRTKGENIRGKVEIRPLSGIKPNPWNPNRMTETVMASLQHGLQTDGWLASQALLVWRTDETGATRNLIIDGEHRYRAALACGMTEGPVVYLDGVSEPEAKALTIKMNQKRGDWDQAALSSLLQELSETLPADVPLALDFGFDEQEFSRALAGLYDEAPPPPPLGAKPDAEATQQTIYSVKIAPPTYTPTMQTQPEIGSLANLEVFERLRAQIDVSNVPADVKEFLRLAAARHIAFDYQTIAEYYAHAPADVQRLMEDSALVIIDFKRAIELGYARMSEKLNQLFDLDHPEGNEGGANG